MTNIDQFESVFKAADKRQFEWESIELKHFMLVTDLDESATKAYHQQVAGYLDVLCDHNEQRLTILHRDRYDGVESVLNQIAETGPDLIVTYRNLNLPAGQHPYSLGVYLDVFTQATRLPIMVFPDPDSRWQPKSPAMNCVMAITDHLTTDSHLVNMAARCTSPNGSLWLTHVEDQATLDRMIGVIGKIPELDTDVAREKIPKQLLKEPHDYIQSCRDQLRASQVNLNIEEDIRLGHHLDDYKQLVSEHAVDLLVMNSKDEEQMAMHGLAYPLSVELRDLPLLLL